MLVAKACHVKSRGLWSEHATLLESGSLAGSLDCRESYFRLGCHLLLFADNHHKLLSDFACVGVERAIFRLENRPFKPV